MALFIGFSTARFSVVLDIGKYGESEWSSLKRYRRTFFHWLDWQRYDLGDANSKGRIAIEAVRTRGVYYKMVWIDFSDFA